MKLKIDGGKSTRIMDPPLNGYGQEMTSASGLGYKKTMAVTG